MASTSGESETDQPSTAAASEPVEIEKKRNEFFQFILRGDHSGLRAMFPDPSPQNDQTHADENAPQPTSVRSGKPKTCRNLPFLGSSSRVHPESQGDRVNKGTAENLLFQSYPSTKDNCMKGALLEGGLPLIVAACNVALPEETQKEIIDILMEKANNIFTPEKIEDLFSLKKNKKSNNVFHELVRLSTQPWVELLFTEENLENSLFIPRSPLKNESTFMMMEEPKSARPLCIDRIKAIMNHIVNKSCELWDKKAKKDVILFQPNDKGYTPLELAVQDGAVHLACYLLDLENVHKVPANSECPDKRLVHQDFVYRLAPLKEITEDLKVVQRFDELFVRKDGALSLMECITVNKGAKAMEFVNIVPLSHAIAEQWSRCLKIHVIWGLVHFLTAVALSVCASFRPSRAEVAYISRAGTTRECPPKSWSCCMPWFFFSSNYMLSPRRARWKILSR